MKSTMFRQILTTIILSILMVVVACSSPKELQVTPIKIVIYTDFQCGACEKLHSEVLPDIRRLYESTGKVNIEMRFLGAIDDISLRAAEAVLCATDQGETLDYENTLFMAWREKDADAYTMEELIRVAGSLGFDEEALRGCLDTGSKRAELDKNMNMARADDVGTLPAIIIDGIKVEGYKPLDNYIKLIEQALKNHGF